MIKNTRYILLICLAFYTSYGQRVEIKGKWKFLKEDSQTYSKIDFDDRSWKEIQPPMISHTAPGYAWYRKQLVIPVKLKEATTKFGYLAVTLGCYDDVGAFYFNEELIGQKGTIIPFRSVWGQPAEFLIPIGKIRWDEKNQIAIRLYSPDSIGAGIHKGPFFMEPLVIKITDFLSISSEAKYESGAVKGNFILANKGEYDFKGKIIYTISDQHKIILKNTISGVRISHGETKPIPFTANVPANDYYEINYTFIDTTITQSVAKNSFFNSINEPSIATTERKLITGYLVDDSFYHMSVYDGSQKVSSWDVDTTEGNSWELAFGAWFKLKDNSSKKGISMKRMFLVQKEGEITWEFKFISPAIPSGLVFQIGNDTTPVVRFVTQNGKICYQDAKRPLQNLLPLKDYGVKAVINLSTGKCVVYINGNRMGEYDLINNQKEISHLIIKTGKDETGEVYIAPVQVYKGYFIHEQFLTVSQANHPEDWQASNGAVVQELSCQPRPDIFSLKMQSFPNDSVTFSKSINTINQKVWFDFRFFSATTAEGFNATIGNDQKKIKILVRDNKIGYLDLNGQFISVHYYTPDLWHHVALCMDPTTGLTDIWINDKPKKKQAQLGAVNEISSVQFSTGKNMQYTLWLDDILLYPWQPEPTDYVPEPVPVKHGPYLIGMQSCSLWKEGSHVGWDFILPVANERKPILGWYDEGKPETSDWQTKFMVEHGIDFNLYCWYQPYLGQGNPIKRGYLDFDLHEGFFYSKYSNMLKFAIMYENWSIGSGGYKDLTENVFNFWIEYYFKDPRYMLVDNKPVVALYNARKLEEQMGSFDLAKKAVEDLRQQCKAAGFANAIIISEFRGNDIKEIEYIKSMGIDYIYSYTWYTGETGPQKRKMSEQFKTGVPFIPSPSMGWEPSAWKSYFGDPPSLASAKTFRNTLSWVKDTLMKKMPSNSLGSKMILLDNWNEFGEGHFIFPSAAFGFGYLDAIRAVFSTNPPHKDQYPTEAQKARVNILYPRGYKED